MKKILLALITLFTTFQLFAAEEAGSSTGVDRYAIYIGCNDGGKERDKLLYASTDAQNFQKIMSEIGGVQDSNSYILIDPTKERIDDTLAKISSKIDSNKMNAKRSEFIFYYSGHSDEESILLGETAYDYSTLKHAISDVPSDIHIVILDSCYSGNFIRTKGGQKKKPFLMDDSSVVKGHAYLSSSSAREYSQESDDIESSYFTNAMITGLRGAADTSGDSKVTLNELYSYAFNDTLSKTESSKAGPQHPNFNITLVGSGDLILSDISNADAMLSISKEAKGTFIIRDSDGKLISEINKTAGQPILMALPVGMYSAVCIDEYSTRQGTFSLTKNSVYVLDQNNLFSVQQKDTTLKGGSVSAMGENGEDSDETYISENSDTSQPQEDFKIGDPFHLFVVPGLPLFRFTRDCSLLSLGMIGSSERCMFGVQASGVMNINSGKLIGVQAAGVFNIVNNDVLGFQTAGVFDIAKNVEGGQAAGVFNIAKSGFGVQAAGVFNISSGSFKGVQAGGVFNVASEIKGVQAAGLFNVAKKVDGLQLGVVNVAKENNGLAI
nr:caspase family protein [Treponema sp.]